MNKKENQVTNLKCQFSNAVHKMLEPSIGVKKSERTPDAEYTDQEKIEMFDMLLAAHKISSEAITSALFKRRERKRVQTARDIRGYSPKHKTTKEEYEAMLHNA